MPRVVQPAQAGRITYSALSRARVRQARGPRSKGGRGFLFASHCGPVDHQSQRDPDGEATSADPSDVHAAPRSGSHPVVDGTRAAVARRRGGSAPPDTTATRGTQRPFPVPKEVIGRARSWPRDIGHRRHTVAHHALATSSALDRIRRTITGCSPTYNGQELIYLYGKAAHTNIGRAPTNGKRWRLVKSPPSSSRRGRDLLTGARA